MSGKQKSALTSIISSSNIDWNGLRSMIVVHSKHQGGGQQKEISGGGYISEMGVGRSQNWEHLHIYTNI